MPRILLTGPNSCSSVHYLELLAAALFTGTLASGGDLLEAAKAAGAAPPSSRAPRAPDLLLDGLALVITEGHAAGTPTL